MRKQPPAGETIAQGAAEATVNKTVIEFRHLLDKLPAGAYMCDPDGLITYFNQRAVEIWGRAPKLHDPQDRFCGSFRLFSSHGMRIQHDQCWMALALQTEREYNGHEIIIERPDGRRLTVLAHANPIRDESGTLLGAVNVLMDITALKQSQEEQRQLQAHLAHLGRISSAGEMASGLAHELNQPLTAIITHGGTCARLIRSGQATPDRILFLIEQMVMQGERAGDLIRHLRDFTRKTEAQRLWVDLNEVVREVMDFLAVEAHDREIRLRVDLLDPLPRIEADPIQIQQVLVNLIRNGFEALSDSASKRRELSVQTALGPAHEIIVTVQDTGPGVAREIQDQLFRPFFTTKSDGMGLGLSLSRSIVQAHGGRIWMTSDPEAGGAIFQFTFPCKGPAPKA